MDVIDVDAKSVETNRKLVSYDITSVPTIVIDGMIKVVGVPNFPWLCGEEFYKTLEEKYTLLQTVE